jgi:hypothetical protein
MFSFSKREAYNFGPLTAKKKKERGYKGGIEKKEKD